MSVTHTASDSGAGIWAWAAFYLLLVPPTNSFSPFCQLTFTDCPLNTRHHAESWQYEELRDVKPGRMVPSPCVCSHGFSMAHFPRKGHTNTTLGAQCQGYQRPSPSLFINLQASQAEDTWPCSIIPRFYSHGLTERALCLRLSWGADCLASYTIWVDTLASVFSSLDAGPASQTCVRAPGSEEPHTWLNVLLTSSWNS